MDATVANHENGRAGLEIAGEQVNLWGRIDFDAHGQHFSADFGAQPDSISIGMTHSRQRPRVFLRLCSRLLWMPLCPDGQRKERRSWSAALNISGKSAKPTEIPFQVRRGDAVEPNHPDLPAAVVG